MKQSKIIWLLILPYYLFGQSIEGTWNYEVLNTVSGDYYGEFIIEKKEDLYKGKIISQGATYNVTFNFIKEDSISISSDVEGFVATIEGKFKKEELLGKVTVLGDSNIYDFYARRTPKDQIFKVLDAQTNEIITYANIIYGKEGTITNEDGLAKIKLKSKESEVMI